MEVETIILKPNMVLYEIKSKNFKHYEILKVGQKRTDGEEACYLGMSNWVLCFWTRNKQKAIDKFNKLNEKVNV